MFAQAGMLTARLWASPLMMSRTLRLMLMALIAMAAFIGVPQLVSAADPNGAATLEADPTAAVNLAWTLTAAFLVFFMQLGFAFLGAGLIRAKNVTNYMTKSFMDFAIASLGFWAFGFAVMFGGSAYFSGLDEGNALIGLSGFFLAGEAYDVSTSTFWLFQVVFAATAATIVAGAVAERMKITAYLAYSFIIGAVIYPVYGHWVWGGGWLGDLSIGGATGVADFAGSGVVHAVGGIAALVGAKMVGPRIGKFNANGLPNVIRGHNLPYVVIGTFILFFGWFGFNAGSTVAATELRIGVIAANTFLAGATGAVVALYWSIARTGKPDVIFACNGALAGLVGITAPCAWVAPWAAVVIGAIAAPVMIGGAYFVERILKVDDVVGAFGVHGAAGIWGILAVGIFADGTYGVSGLVDGEAGQLAIQAVNVAVVVAWTGTTAFLTFGLLKMTMGLRASREEELEGLDISEHGLPAYPLELPAPAGASK